MFDSGAGDLLQVRLNTSPKLSDGAGKLESEMRSSAPLVWVPFVEAIVPTVDMNKREMLITPPKGLLELNVRSDERSKKERRQLVRHTLLFFITNLPNIILRKSNFFLHINIKILRTSTSLWSHKKHLCSIRFPCELRGGNYVIFLWPC